MGTSLQRVLAITIVIKIVVVIASLIFTGVSFDTEQLNTPISQQKERSDMMGNDFQDTNIETDNEYRQKQFGDVKLGQKLSFYDVLRSGIGWIPQSYINSNDELQKRALTIFNMFMMLINAILSLEITMFIYSRKYS